MDHTSTVAMDKALGITGWLILISFLLRAAGVVWDKEHMMWRSVLPIGAEKVRLGYHDDELEAALQVRRRRRRRRRRRMMMMMMMMIMIEIIIMIMIIMMGD
jgi:hypothetical protein